MNSTRIPEEERKSASQETVIVFMDIFLYWMDGNTNHRHEELIAIVNIIIELFITASEPFLFSSATWKRI